MRSQARQYAQSAQHRRAPPVRYSVAAAAVPIVAMVAAVYPVPMAVVVLAVVAVARYGRAAE
ncbi:hypothetical protein DP107_12405 [Haloglomus irregulare]|jgi:hypothetical protein|uniref:Uncharacterized protein n=1 Tax=Haloglomus irregulare TaxID=2234134 RepID=A0A554N7B8_9EURY|nr:hypothetical protein [Haloglomus irregulare]TSD13292.1 hypothetical protein DP107_12405 [Haloglomus irregulare]